MDLGYLKFDLLEVVVGRVPTNLLHQNLPLEKLKKLKTLTECAFFCTFVAKSISNHDDERKNDTENYQ